MYDFLDKIGLKAVLEAIKGKMPTSLPANGGNADYADNADKLDGLHSASFLQNVVPVNLTTSINDMTTAGTYGVYSETPDFPSGYGSWGFLEVRRFGILCYQTIIFENGVIINRGIQTNGGNWSNWRCAYTNIDKPYVTGTVSAKYGEKAKVSFGFTPSMVLYQPANPRSNVPGSIYQATMGVDANGFTPNQSTYKEEDSCSFVYIAFK